MESRGNKPDASNADRLTRIHRLIDDCIERRIAGETLSRDVLITDHPDLMPELAEELRHLEVIERARRRVTGSSQLDPLDAPVARESALGADVFPGYDIAEEVHRGGQGVVYRAVQRSTQRPVALKVVREGVFAGARELARFEREIEVLSALRHPNVVRVLDRGVTAGGSFYYTMDYIAGLPADAFVRSGDGPPSIDAVLDLFLTICDAVHAAHLNGVIHRDIKPSNIRVDALGKPYVLDFGLAKHASNIDTSDPDATTLGAMTLTGQFVGSVPWASPEQATGASDIDVRTDVYALGLLLYNLLTDAFPYDVKGAPREVLDRIVHTAPDPPSMHRRDISDELETIILHCLAKARDRRYESAGALAQDVRRMRAGSPIEAKRDSTWYVFRKTLWRYRIVAGVAATFFIVVSVAAIWLAQLYAAQREQSALAQAAAADARRQADRAEAINRLLETAIAAANPYEERGADYTVRELLDEFNATLEAESETDPHVLASIHTALGKAYRGLGLPILAHPHFREAMTLYRELYEPPQIDLANSVNEYGLSLLGLGSNGLALATFEEAHEMIGALHGEDHEDTIRIKSNVASALHNLSRDDEAEALMVEIVEQTRADDGPPPMALATYLLNLAMVKSKRGDLEGAVAHGEEALGIARAHASTAGIETAQVLSNLASLYREAGNLESAEQMQHEALTMQRVVFGDEHPAVAECHSHLAILTLNLGRFDESLEHGLKALAIYRAVYPEPHLKILLQLNSIVQIYIARKEPDKALPYAANLVEQSIAIHGEEDYNVVGALNTRAQLHMMQGNYDASIADFRDALAMVRQLYGDEHPAVPVLMNNLGLCLSKQDKDREAAEVYREGLEIAQRIHPEDHPGIVSLTVQLAEALKFCGDYEASKPLYEEGLAMRRRVFGSDNVYTAYALNGFGDLYIEMRDFAPAEPLYRESIDISTQGLPDGHESLAIPFANLGRVLVELDRSQEAETYLRRGLALRIATRASGDKLVARAQYWMGRCLIDLGEYEEAEMQLNAALESRLADANQLPWRRAVVMARIGEICTARAEYDEAETLLTDAYRLAADDPTVRPFILREIAGLLVELFTSTGSAADRAHWETIQNEWPDE